MSFPLADDADFRLIAVIEGCIAILPVQLAVPLGGKHYYKGQSACMKRGNTYLWRPHWLSNGYSVSVQYPAEDAISSY